jgi:hypothetical protein
MAKKRDVFRNVLSIAEHKKKLCPIKLSTFGGKMSALSLGNESFVGYS